MRILKRIVKRIVKTVAIIAGLVFLFDNRVTGIAGTILLLSIAVLFASGIAWVILEHYWPEDEEGITSGQ